MCYLEDEKTLERKRKPYVEKQEVKNPPTKKEEPEEEESSSSEEESESANAHWIWLMLVCILCGILGAAIYLNTLNG